MLSLLNIYAILGVFLLIYLVSKWHQTRSTKYYFLENDLWRDVFNKTDLKHMVNS